MKLTATDWIWRDGTFVPWNDCNLHLLSHSMQYGSAIFEGIRCYKTTTGPQIFRLREHLDRLMGSAKVYRFDMQWSVEDLINASRQVVTKNGMEACYLRPMVLRGYGAASMVPFASPVEVFIPCWPFGAYLGDGAQDAGVDVCVSSWQRVAPNTIPTMAKIAGNYLSGMLIKMQALADGYAEAIALGPDGKISESSGANTFLVKNGALYTAPVDASLLPGITRDTVMTIAHDLGIPVHERELLRESVYLADEIFFCGTAVEITPVRSVDRITVGTGTVGPVTKALQQRFMETVTGKVADTHGWLTPVRA